MSSFTTKQKEGIRAEIGKMLDARLEKEGETFTMIFNNINQKNDEIKAMHVELYSHLIKVKSEVDSSLVDN